MATSLRHLAKDYALGTITREEYLRRRRQFIDDAVAGRSELREDEPRRAAPPSAAQTAAAAATPPPQGRTGLLIGVIAVVVVAVAGGTYLFWHRHKPAPVPAPVAKQAGPNPAQFVKDFLARNNWERPAVDKLVKDWDALDAATRAKVVQSSSYGFLGDAIYEQIVEEQALADLGDHEKAVAAQEYLAGVARHLGMKGDRFQIAASQPKEEQPAAAPSGGAAQTAAETAPPAAATAAAPAVVAEAPAPAPVPAASTHTESAQPERGTAPEAAAPAEPAKSEEQPAATASKPAEAIAGQASPAEAAPAAESPAEAGTPPATTRAAAPEAAKPAAPERAETQETAKAEEQPPATAPQPAEATAAQTASAEKEAATAKAAAGAAPKPEAPAPKAAAEEKQTAGGAAKIAKTPKPSGAAEAVTSAAAAGAAAAAAAKAEAKTEPAAKPKPMQAEKTKAATEAATAEKAARPPAGTAKPAQSGNRYACRAALANTRRPYCRDDLADGGHGPVMVVIPAGSFKMGGSRADEQPVHEVRIPRPLAISMQEISFHEFEQFCKDAKRECPSQPWSGAEYPVVNVSWFDAEAYTKWLSKETGRHYRLPSEAEWEYAARGGTTTAYPFGDEILPTSARFSYQTQVTSPLPNSDRSINRNRFRLYNMVGNVAEWVEDTWHDNYQGAPSDGRPVLGGNQSLRVVRGGSYKDGAEALRSAARAKAKANAGEPTIGFRVVEDLGPAGDAAAADPVDDSRWLNAQNGSAYTLQLFAVRQPDQLQSIIRAHPDVALKLLPVQDGRFRYRLLYGVFKTKASARNAFGKLPADITRRAGKPVVKSIADLKKTALVSAP